MTWKEEKAWEGTAPSVFAGTLCLWAPNPIKARRVRVTIEVEEPKYRARAQGSANNAGWVVAMGDGMGFVYFKSDYPGGAQVAAELEAARLNALAEEGEA